MNDPLRKLPPELTAEARAAMREKARRQLAVVQTFAEMSDEWVADQLRMLDRNDLWHESFCCSARDRIMRLSLRNAVLVEKLRELAGECANCGGAGAVTGMCGGVKMDGEGPCPDCADIREYLK